MPTSNTPIDINQSIHPFVMVIFGATGDLTARKLMPALYNLLANGILPDNFLVVGFARRSLSHDQFRSMMKEAVVKYSKDQNINYRILLKLTNNLYYQQGFFEEITPYKEVVKHLLAFDKDRGACITRFFYLAAPPVNYPSILKNLLQSKLSEGCGQGSGRWTRVLIEKPFGKDMETAKKLEEQLSNTFTEKQIYRIDHYLAKEIVQNILAFRFANSIFENIWNKDHIDNIQISLMEAGGVGERGAFYEGVGVLKDVVQNHLMAMLAFTAMEQPKKLDVESIRTERVKVLQKIRRLTPGEIKANVVRGQYSSGALNGHKIHAYREEKNVDSASQTETFAALKLFIDNPRWQGVPIYLRTGKRMAKSVARISVQFKKVHNALFQNLPPDVERSHHDVLTFRIHPRPGISLQMLAKEPGLGFSLKNVKMDFSYENVFGMQTFDSYERLLLDSMIGDQTLFATNAGFNATWSLVTDILNVWGKESAPKFPNYKPGSWGPHEADLLIKKDGRYWLLH